jgi:hypothetical protein
MKIQFDTKLLAWLAIPFVLWAVWFLFIGVIMFAETLNSSGDQHTFGIIFCTQCLIEVFWSSAVAYFLWRCFR